jgi:hypothetical protein
MHDATIPRPYIIFRYLYLMRKGEGGADGFSGPSTPGCVGLGGIAIIIILYTK